MPRLAAYPRPVIGLLGAEGGGAPEPGDGGACDPFDLASRAEDREQIARALTKLRHGRDREVIIRRFGLDGEPPETLAEVGERFGVSAERVRQLLIRGLARLRLLRVVE